MTGVDWTVAVAAWLTEPPRRQVPLRALGELLRDVPREERLAASAEVQDALDHLDAAGLIVVAHRYPTPIVGVLDQDGLRHIAEAGHPQVDLLSPAETG
jgi:hypothetical protein